MKLLEHYLKILMYNAFRSTASSARRILSNRVVRDVVVVVVFFTSRLDQLLMTRYKLPSPFSHGPILFSIWDG